ncbi:MAG: hypothetical protein ACK40M_10975 [Flavobacteriales bacterium]
MKPSTELFELIKSLTKSEKRFFKLSSSLQEGEKNYLKIFDSIDKQQEYDEESIKNQFNGETFIRHFPSEKNHLYKLILKSLRSYHADNSISSILRQEIKNIEILFKKGLYKECHKFLQRSKKLAIEHEKFYYQFELINIEKQLLEEDYESGEFDKDLNALVEEETQCIEKLRNLAEYHIIFSRINFVFRREGFAHNEEERAIVQEIEDYHLIKGKNTALSARASTICYYIKGLCATTNRQYQDAFTFFLKTKEIFDKNPHIRTDLAKRYLKTLTSLLYGYIDTNNIEAANNLIKVLVDLKEEDGFDSLEMEVKIFTSTHIAQLMLLNKTGDFRKAIELSKDVNTAMDKYGERINKEQRLLFTYTISYAYFGAGDYKEALQWINDVLNMNEQTLRRDVFNFARVFNLLIHLELGNYDLLEYTVKSTVRYLNKKEKDYQSETVFIKHLRKLIRSNSDMERKEIYEEMYQEFSELLNNPIEQVILEYVDILSWLESKRKNISFAEAVRARSLANA